MTPDVPDDAVDACRGLIGAGYRYGERVGEGVIMQLEADLDDVEWCDTEARDEA